MADTSAKPAAKTPAPTPKNGSLVTDGAGRYGIVLDGGREPDKDKQESPEPVVAWLPDAGPYGGEITPVS